MALFEVFTIMATQVLIDPTNSTDIPQGSVVRQNASTGLCELAEDTGATPLGLAADSRSQGVTSYTAESGSALSSNPKTSLTGALVVGSAAAYPSTGVLARRFTQNRVADQYNEVLASGKMTVYTAGEFWTDQYVTGTDNSQTVDLDPGDIVYPGRDSGNNGKLSDQAPASVPHLYVVGVVMTAPTQYPSGVPGTTTDWTHLPEGGNSLSYGTMVHVKLK